MHMLIYACLIYLDCTRFFFNLSFKVHMRVWMIKVYKVTHRSDISSFPCDWCSVLNFTLIVKASLISVLVKEVWLLFVGNYLNQMCISVYSCILILWKVWFFAIKTTKKLNIILLALWVKCLLSLNLLFISLLGSVSKVCEVFNVSIFNLWYMYMYLFSFVLWHIWQLQ